MTRPTWPEYFMHMAHEATSRATCLRRKVACVIVYDKEIAATGYNGPPKKCEHCTPETCLRLNVPSGTRHELCRASHAEMNAICSAAKRGVPIDKTVIFITCQPCSMCAKMIINSGIKCVVYDGEGYPDKLALDLLTEAGVAVFRFGAWDNDQILNYM